MGVELVEASDLVVRDDVALHAHDRRACERVHAVYRRLDDDFVDPLEFRPDSLLGVPGLVRAYRAGTVAIANALGTGVADDKAIYHYVPEMIRFYLGEEPILDNVQTYLMADDQQRETRWAAATSWSSSRRASPAARASSSARARRVEALDGARRRDPRPARATGSPRSSSTSRPSRPPGPTARSRRATSTCGRSPCSARRSGSCPAA